MYNVGQCIPCIYDAGVGVYSSILVYTRILSIRFISFRRHYTQKRHEQVRTPFIGDEYYIFITTDACNVMPDRSRCITFMSIILTSCVQTV